MNKVKFLAPAAVLFIAILLPAQPQAQIALLDSNYARDFFERHYPACDPAGGSYYLGGDEYKRYFLGWQWVLEQQQLPFQILKDEDITAEGLSGFRLLILSNNALLSVDQTRAVHQWVLRGGRLLATFGSGYKYLLCDPREADSWKVQRGGTFGLHQLWHDPVGKLFSTFWVDTGIHAGVDVRITRYEGPTANLRLTGDILHYGADSNILVQRPVNHHEVLAFLIFDNPDWKAPSPAIISTRQSKGLVVYFAFAPEYIVYKELEYEDEDGLRARGWPVCRDTGNWTDRGAEPMDLMVGTLWYLLTAESKDPPGRQGKQLGREPLLPSIGSVLTHAGSAGERAKPPRYEIR